MKIKALLVSLLLLIFSLFVYGQNKIQGYVLDKQTSLPLSYATIGALHQQYGSYTDTTGLFTLYYLNESDSLKVSYMGYKVLFTKVIDLKKRANILLEPDLVQLKEVVVSPRKIKNKKIEIGFFTKKPGVFKYPSPGINLETTFIPFPKEGSIVLIKTIKFTYEMKSKNSPLRIHVLKVMDNGEPGADMITQNIIFNNYKEGINQVATIDVSKHNVYMPGNGVFIALEWLDMDRTPALALEQPRKNGPSICVKKTGDSSYSKWVNYYNQSKWKEWPNPFTNAIGLTVVNYTE